MRSPSRNDRSCWDEVMRFSIKSFHWFGSREDQQKTTGFPMKYIQILDFPAKFPLNQSIETCARWILNISSVDHLIVGICI